MSQHEKMNDDKVDWGAPYYQGDTIITPQDKIHYGRNLWRQTRGTTWEEKSSTGTDGKKRPVYTFDYNVHCLISDLVQDDIIPMSPEISEYLKAHTRLTRNILIKALSKDLATTLSKKNESNYVLITGANNEVLFDNRPQQESGFHYQKFSHTYERKELRDIYSNKVLKDKNGYRLYEKVHFLDMYNYSGGTHNDHSNNDYWIHDNEKILQTLGGDQE